MLLRMSSTPFVVGATVQLHPATVHAGGPPVTAALATAVVSSAGGVSFSGLEPETEFWLVGQDPQGAWRWVKVRTRGSETAHFTVSDPEDLPFEIDLPADQSERAFVVRRNGVDLFSIDADGVLDVTGVNGPEPLLLRSEAPRNVRQFGAVGDGVTDDRLAFQAAIDAAHAEWLVSGVRQRVTALGEFYINFAPVKTPNLGGTEFLYGLVLKSGVLLDLHGAVLRFRKIPTATMTAAVDLLPDYGGYSDLPVDSTAEFVSTDGEVLIQFSGVADTASYLTAYKTPTVLGHVHSDLGSLLPIGTVVAERQARAGIITDWTVEEVLDSGVVGGELDGQNVGAVELNSPAILPLNVKRFVVEGVLLHRWMGKAVFVFATGGYVCSRVRICGNEITDCGSNAVGWTAMIDSNIDDNFIHDIKGGPDGTGAESLIGGLDGIATRLSVRRNRILQWGTVDVGGDDLAVEDNYIDALAGQLGPGIRVFGAARQSIRRNTINMAAASYNQAHGINYGGIGDFSLLTITDNIVICDASGEAIGISLFVNDGQPMIDYVAIEDNTIVSATDPSTGNGIVVRRAAVLKLRGNTLIGDRAISIFTQGCGRVRYTDNDLGGVAAAVGGTTLVDNDNIA